MTVSVINNRDNIFEQNNLDELFKNYLAVLPRVLHEYSLRDYMW